MRTLVWFRGKDLRVSDHEPLHDSARRGELVCAFVLDPYFFAPSRARELPHRMQFLLESIADLAATLERLGSALALVPGQSVEVVPRIARQWGVDRVVAHRWVEPFGRVRDERIGRALHVPFELWEGETLAPPDSVRTAQGRPFSVFTPFARAHRAATHVGPPRRAPSRLPPVPPGVRFPRAALPTLSELGIARNPNLLRGGEAAARHRLTRFLRNNAAHYAEDRDRLDLAATSRLSADLKFGTLSVRTVWTSAKRALERGHPAAWEKFSTELLWREFTHALLWNHPELLKEPARAEWARFPWENDSAHWQAWCDGTTGYPVVDAAARQLLAEGFVHNRARTISASFLVKDLLVDYRLGEAHYLKYLTDGDWAQNNTGWQWSAGCGCDAQPFFRVFNPVEQGKRFDPTGEYVRRWVPELAALPDAYIHEPWTSPPRELRAAGVELGATYPRPIVDHAKARQRFLSLARRLGPRKRAR
jgi:deoxyribodipyrimidine photo-lyase